MSSALSNNWGVDLLTLMAEEQLSALLAKLKEDTGLRERIKDAADQDAAIAAAREAGFDVSREDYLRYQEKQVLELSDQQLEAVAGGGKWCERTDKFSCTNKDKGQIC